MRRKTYDIVALNVVCDDADALRKVVLETGIEQDMTVRLIAERANDRSCSSIDDKARQWATIGNQALDASMGDAASHTLWLEADLSVPYDALDILLSRDRDIIAPLIWLGGVFYDSWAFRDLSGRKIHGFGGIDMTRLPEPIELGSVGSCVLMRSEILARGVRLPGVYEGGLLVGLCNQARSLGYCCFADPMVAIAHPTLSWLEQVYRVERVRTFDGDGRCCEIAPSRILPGLHDEFVLEFLAGLIRTLALPAAPGAYAMRIDVRKDRGSSIDLRWRGTDASGGVGLAPGVAVDLPIERVFA